MCWQTVRHLSDSTEVTHCVFLAFSCWELGAKREAMRESGSDAQSGSSMAPSLAKGEPFMKELHEGRGFYWPGQKPDCHESERCEEVNVFKAQR